MMFLYVCIFDCINNPANAPAMWPRVQDGGVGGAVLLFSLSDAN